MDGGQELQNKVDAENTEIEEIKDDAEAMEDNEKEKLRKEEEQTNAVVDAPENDKLEDDVDSDKDYWEKKYKELESKFAIMEAEFEGVKSELSVYKAEEDKRSMRKYLESFKNCFSSEDFDVMASKIDTVEKVDFEKEVDDMVKEFVKKTYCNQKNSSEEDGVDIKNSAGFIPNVEDNTQMFGSKKLETLDDVLSTYKK